MKISLKFNELFFHVKKITGVDTPLLLKRHRYLCYFLQLFCYNVSDKVCCPGASDFTSPRAKTFCFHSLVYNVRYLTQATYIQVFHKIIVKQIEKSLHGKSRRNVQRIGVGLWLIPTNHKVAISSNHGAIISAKLWIRVINRDRQPVGQLSPKLRTGCHAAGNNHTGRFEF
jgi:hypothetical protein